MSDPRTDEELLAVVDGEPEAFGGLLPPAFQPPADPAVDSLRLRYLR
jgi:hypothetical protein